MFCKYLLHACPLDLRIALVVERVKLCLAAQHVAEILHSLPWWIEVVFCGHQRAHGLDDQVERAETTGAEQLELFAGQFGGNYRQSSRTYLIAGDAKISRC